jgi:adenylate kinase
MNFALIGPPGSGKATLAQRLERRFDIARVSPDQVLSEAIARRSTLGLLAKRYIQQNELLPEELLEGLLEERLRALPPESGLLLEGFPRTRAQATFLDSLLLGLGRNLDAVLRLTLSEAAALDRLPGRLVCRECRSPFHDRLLPFDTCPDARCDGEHLYRRDDDQRQLALLRLAAFRRSNAPLLERYQATGKLVLVDAAAPLEVVEATAVQILEGFRERRPAPVTSIDELHRVRALHQSVSPLSRGAVSHQSVDIAFLGGPGSGKGTQSERLAAELGVSHVASGDLFRENLRDETPLGRLARTYMDRGELVPDDVTEGMLRERLTQPDVAQGFVLDGFPRTLPQAEALTEMLTAAGRRLAAVIHLSVPDAVIVERLSGRLVCRECQRPFHESERPFEVCPENRCQGEHLYRRDDDTPDTIRARLRTYHAETEPLIEYYEQAELLLEVDGVGAVDAILGRIREAIAPLTQR